MPTQGNAITGDRRKVFGMLDCDQFVKSLCELFALGLQADALRIHIPSIVAARWPNNSITKRRCSKMRLDPTEGANHVYSVGKPSTLWDESQRPHPESRLWVIAECQLEGSQPSGTASPLGTAFMEHLGTCLLPYDLSERRRLFRAAFAELSPFIEAHEVIFKDLPKT